MILRILRCARIWLRKLTTARDNQTPDCIRIGGILMGTQFLVNSAWATFVLKQDWDAANYGQGAGLILGAIGLALGVKHFTEPR